MPDVSVPPKQVGNHAVTICLLVGLWITGCRWPTGARLPELSPNTPEQDDRSAQVADREVLAKDGWSRTPAVGGQSRGQPAYRWRFSELEELLGRPPEGRPDLMTALGDDDPVVAGNAAIGMARLGNPAGAAQLVAAVGGDALKLPIRCAAAEALGSLPGRSTVERLRELIDRFGRQDASGTIPALHAELIRALAGHVEVAEDPRFADALHSPAVGVRREALAAWIGRGDWTATPGANKQLAGPGYRWRCSGLERLLDLPPGKRPELRPALADDDPVLATAAAIGLARLGDASGAQRLVAAVGNPELKLPLRCAAAEALGSIREPSLAESLRGLIDQYACLGPDVRSRPVPELHAELIRSLALHVEAAHEKRLAEALASPAAGVRRSALLAWAGGTDGSLPPEAVDLRTDPDPQVRAAAMWALGRRRHPEALHILTASLHDLDLQVRIGTIAALGELGGAEAQAALEDSLEHGTELIRAAAVSALAKSGAEHSLRDAASDKSWRVRAAVADALAGYPNRHAAAVARELITDSSLPVQRRVIAAISNWPLELAGPILLVGMEQRDRVARAKATEQLARRWPPAAQSPPDGLADRRGESLKELRRQFREQVGFADPAALAGDAEEPDGSGVRPVQQKTTEQVEQLVEQLSDPGLHGSARQQVVQALVNCGPQLLKTLERLALDRRQELPEAIYREVLPRTSAAFAALDRLASKEVSQRRAAAEELAGLAAGRPLGRLVLERLAWLVVMETDALVWQNVFTAVAGDPGEPSIRLACAAIGHRSAEVRRRACQHLAAHADPGHAAVLLPVLKDPSPTVVLAAVGALGAGGRLDDTEPLRQLLATDDEPLRAEVAASLAQLGDPAGPAELERLAYSDDPAIRRRVATAMGELGDVQFVPTLIRLLDDRQGVRRAALDGLPKVVGHEVGDDEDGSPKLRAERISQWKQWYRQR